MPAVAMKSDIDLPLSFIHLDLYCARHSPARIWSASINGKLGCVASLWAESPFFGGGVELCWGARAEMGWVVCSHKGHKTGSEWSDGGHLPTQTESLSLSLSSHCAAAFSLLFHHPPPSNITTTTIISLASSLIAHSPIP